MRRLVVGGRKENLTPPPRASLNEVASAVIDGFWALMLPVIIIVGLRFGIFTPTEAGVVVAVYSLFVATCIYRELKLSQLYERFRLRGGDDQHRDVPGRRGAGVVLADHGRRRFRRRSSTC